MIPKIQALDQIIISTPIGNISVFHNDHHIFAIKPSQEVENQEARKSKISSELIEYFIGKREKFSLSLQPQGTELQKRIWLSMVDISYGHVLTYKELGTKLNLHARTIGMACRTNPIPILIPCHRIISTHKGSEHYSFLNGTDTKLWLLDHEQKKHEDFSKKLAI